MRSPIFALCSALLAFGTLPACSIVEAPKQLRGNRVDAESLKDLVPGTSTRADVQALLGSPSAKATFDDNTWLYVSETTRPRVGRTPGVLDQEVVALNFDQSGTLRGIKRLDQKDGKAVAVVSRATPSPGSEASFMQQLLGNVGRFSTGGLPGVGGAGGARRPGGSGADSGGSL